jgi:hypothetical protein
MVLSTHTALLPHSSHMHHSRVRTTLLRTCLYACAGPAFALYLELNLARALSLHVAFGRRAGSLVGSHSPPGSSLAVGPPYPTTPGACGPPLLGLKPRGPKWGAHPLFCAHTLLGLSKLLDDHVTYFRPGVKAPGPKIPKNGVHFCTPNFGPRGTSPRSVCQFAHTTKKFSYIIRLWTHFFDSFFTVPTPK